MRRERVNHLLSPARMQSVNILGAELMMSTLACGLWWSKTAGVIGMTLAPC